MLIAGVILAGVLTYRLTAPPAGPGEPRFSLRHIVEHARDELGDPAILSINKTIPVPEGVTTLRIADFEGELAILGDDRDDITVELTAAVRPARAGRRPIPPPPPPPPGPPGAGSVPPTPPIPEPGEAGPAGDIVLRTDGDTAVLAVDIEGAFRRGAEMTVRVPAWLQLSVDASGRLTVGGVAALSATSRGDAEVEDVDGAVRIDHRGGDVEVTRVGSVEIVARRAEVRIEHVDGPARLEVSDGAIAVDAVGGPLELDARRTQAELDGLDAEATLVVTDSEVEVRGVTAAVRFDGTRSALALELDAAAPLDLRTSNRDIEVSIEEGVSLHIEALATRGDIDRGDLDLSVTREGSDVRASGVIGGDGAPRALIRVTRGRIVLRRD